MMTARRRHLGGGDRVITRAAMSGWRAGGGDQWRGASRWRSVDRGSVSLEAVLILPAFILFLTLIVGIARVAMVQADVHAAAVTGTRAALMAPDPDQGSVIAHQEVYAQIAQESVPCPNPTITADTTALGYAVGQPGRVSVELSCVVALADLLLPGAPGQIVITDSFSSPIDPYSLR